MSMGAYKWAKTNFSGELTSPQHFVLLMIADHFNETEQRAWPSIQTLAIETSLNPTSVTRALRVLESKSLIETEAWFRLPSNKRMSNRYCLPFYRDDIPNRRVVKTRDERPRPVDKSRWKG